MDAKAGGSVILQVGGNCGLMGDIHTLERNDESGIIRALRCQWEPTE